jgi:N-acetylmuramic acid 6-phosphate etherase
MTETTSVVATELIEPELLDLDMRSNDAILSTLLESQQRAVVAVDKARSALDKAIALSAQRLLAGEGRLVMVGAGASGRLAVQDAAELWPTFSWPAKRLLGVMAGGNDALVQSIEGIEDDVQAATKQVETYQICSKDVVLCVAASGRSPWTCQWLAESCRAGALGIGMANNIDTPLLQLADCPLFLDTGAEVLAGSTRMSAGTAKKIALNLFSTTLMIRLNRTYGNLMVDMAAVNSKLDQRRIRLLQGVLQDIDDKQAQACITQANGWVKLAALIACGDSTDMGRRRLDAHAGSLRKALLEINSKNVADDGMPETSV